MIGAGQMGTGIAQVCALAGIEVALNDISEAHINAGLATIAGNLARQVERKQIDPPARDAALSRIKPAPGYDAFADSDLVIEAATENEEVKRKIFSKLCPSLKPTAMLATNTSSISITRLASITDRPERFIGIHFMNPVPRMQLVELIRGIVTENATFDAAGADRPARQDLYRIRGFPRLHRQSHSAADDQRSDLYALRGRGLGRIDRHRDAARREYPMGPLQLADFIGLDTALSVMQLLHDGMADPKYRPCPLLVKYVEAGWLGRKTQRGFYDYRSGTPIPTR